MKVPESIKKCFDEWCLIFSLYFVIFSLCWLGFAIFGDGEKTFRSFIIYSLGWSLGMSIIVSLIGNGFGKFLKEISKIYNEISDREKRYCWNWIKYRSALFIAGCCFMAMMLFIFDLELSDRFNDIYTLSIIIQNDIYMMLVAGISTVWIMETIDMIGISKCRSRHWGR